jgi:hypothetical protein
MDRVPPLLQAKRGLFAPLVLMGLASALGIVFVFDPAEHGFYPICFFRLVTGLNCPGCGSMRALHELLHGHIAAAARLNLLFVACLPFAAWKIGRHTAGWLSGQAVAFAIRPIWLWAFLTVSAAFTAIRNLPGFEWLVP